ncbi:MAG TPA: hypothetical protein VKY74_06390, partial [Chloroflexia bacterium]|nr:hypothetical protein [Chloroflexia bacterium]
LVLPLFWAWFIVEWRLSLGWDLPASVAAGRPVPSSWQPIGLPHLSLEAPDMAPAQFQGVYALIQQKTRPGEPIYAFPNEQAFYVFCDRPRGSRYSFLLPGVTTDAEQQAVMGDLRQNNVRYVIMFVPAPGMERVTAGYGALDPLADYIRSHYHALQVFGERPGYAVMERN